MNYVQNFQDLILELHRFWAGKNCAILQPHDLEMGAGTFHPATALRTLGPAPWSAAYVQPSRRPVDGRYSSNPNRLQMHHQYQVIQKPCPENLQEDYLASLEHLGVDISKQDIRFVEDDWESQTLGAWGLGWEVWFNGMEISQFTYFQQVAGKPCMPAAAEITYGLERLALAIFDQDSIFEIPYSSNGITYGDLFQQAEQEYSTWNFEIADTEILFQNLENAETECKNILKSANLALPAYDQCIKASHYLNLLDARNAVGVTERATRIQKIAKLAQACAEAYLKNLDPAKLAKI